MRTWAVGTKLVCTTKRSHKAVLLYMSPRNRAEWGESQELCTRKPACGGFYLYKRDMYNERLQKRMPTKTNPNKNGRKIGARSFLWMQRAYSANSVTIFRITFEAASMLSSGTYSNRPWKFSPPAKMFGQGRPLKERLAPSVPPRMGWM